MAFFKNFQQNLNLPSVSSLVDTLSNAVDDLTNAVGDVSYTVADSVTEQVTNMINSLRTDETAKTQEDKSEVGKEENRTNNDIEKYVREKFDDRGEHNIDKTQRQLNFVEPNERNDSEVYRELNNSIKHKRQTGNKYLESNTLPKDIAENYGICRSEESHHEKPSKKLYAKLEQSKDPLQKKVKKRSPEVDFMDAKKTQSIVTKNVESNKVQTSKLPELRSEVVYSIHEVKSKKPKTFSDYTRKSVTKEKENALSALSKEDTKQKQTESENFSKEVSSKKTPAKDNSYINKEQHGSSSESEDEALGKYHEALSRTQSSRPPAGDNRQQKNYIWETRQKYSPLSAEYDGYSSEASIDEGKHNEG